MALLKEKRDFDVNSSKKISKKFAELQKNLKPLREKLINHKMFHQMKTLDDLRIFQEYHVFAVWDFMSLIKTLQLELTGIKVPWMPKGNANTRRFINEIVLGEESDEDGQGGYLSHFEMYLMAMEKTGADTSKITEVLKYLEEDMPLEKALARVQVAPAVKDFIQGTFEIIETSSLPAIASAFTFGREELIPDMFRVLIGDLKQIFPNQLNLFYYYLERHIELDEDVHFPLAMEMLQELCQEDSQCWQEVKETAIKALTKRLQLWDAISQKIEGKNLPRK